MSGLDGEASPSRRFTGVEAIPHFSRRANTPSAARVAAARARRPRGRTEPPVGDRRPRRVGRLPGQRTGGRGRTRSASWRLGWTRLKPGSRTSTAARSTTDVFYIPGVRSQPRATTMSSRSTGFHPGRLGAGGTLAMDADPYFDLAAARKRSASRIAEAVADTAARRRVAIPHHELLIASTTRHRGHGRARRAPCRSAIALRGRRGGGCEVADTKLVMEACLPRGARELASGAYVVARPSAAKTSRLLAGFARERRTGRAGP